MEESLLKQLHKAPSLRIIADECTHVTIIEELTICCHWVESGTSEEHCIEILPLKKANAESIYSASVEDCREKSIWLGKHIGMFVHSQCHVLQLASVQAANATPGIKHLYTILMTLWQFFHYSPKHAASGQYCPLKHILC